MFDQQARIRAAHFDGVRILLQESGQHLARRLGLARHLRQGQHGQLGVRLDGQRLVRFADGALTLADRQGALRQHQVRFEHVQVGLRQARHHRIGIQLVIRARQNLLHLEQGHAARARRRIGQALGENRFRFFDLVRQHDKAEEELRRLVRIGRQLAPQADGRQRFATLLGGQRHFRSAARQARVARLLRRHHHRHVRPLPLAALEFHLGAGQLVQQVAAQFDLGQFLALGVVAGFGVGHLQRGGRSRAGRPIGRGDRRLRHGMRGHQGGQGYNGESVFQRLILAKRQSLILRPTRLSRTSRM